MHPYEEEEAENLNTTYDVAKHYLPIRLIPPTPEELEAKRARDKAEMKSKRRGGAVKGA